MRGGAKRRHGNTVKQKIDKIRGICYTVYHNRRGGGIDGIEKRIRFGIIDNI